MDKKSPKGRKRSAKGASSSSSSGGAGPSTASHDDDGTWDCSVCTFKNHPEAFKCSMCDVRKGTSTRKPRINPDLVAAQHAQALTPPPPLSTTPTPLASTSAYDYIEDDDDDEELTPPPKLPKKSVVKEKKAAGKTVKDKEAIAKEKKEKSALNKAKLKNVDRSSATYHSVTVDDITVVITEFKPKKPKEKKEKKEGGAKKEGGGGKGNNNTSEDGAGTSTAVSPTPSLNGKADPASSSSSSSGGANGTHGGLAYVKSGATPLSPPLVKVKKEEAATKIVRPAIKKEDPTSPRGAGSAFSGVKLESTASSEVKSEAGGQASTSNGAKV